MLLSPTVAIRVAQTPLTFGEDERERGLYLAERGGVGLVHSGLLQSEVGFAVNADGQENGDTFIISDCVLRRC